VPEIERSGLGTLGHPHEDESPIHSWGQPRLKSEHDEQMSIEPTDPDRRPSPAGATFPVAVVIAAISIAVGLVLWIALASPQPGTVAGLGGAAVLFSAGLAFLNGHLERKHNIAIERDRRDDAALDRKQTDKYELARLDELTTSRIATSDAERARMDELLTAREQAHLRETIHDLRARFATAAAQLADAAAPVRLAGVFSLGSLADDWAALHPLTAAITERQVCIDLLCAYLRNDTANELTMLSRISPEDLPALADVLRDEEVRVRTAIVELIQTHTTFLPEYQNNPTWQGSKFDLSAAKLPNASLGSVDLAGAFLVGTDLTDADLKGIRLHSADLSDAVLTNAWLNSARLTTANLIGATLTGAHLDGVNFAGARMRDLDFRGTTCGAAVFHRARLIGAKFVGADLDFADFAGARLGGADFSGCNLNEVCFDNADLRGTNFSRARFTDTTTFHDVQVDAETTWPDGSNNLPGFVTLRADTTPGD